MGIEGCRDSISIIDKRILTLISERMRVSDEIGKLKRMNGMPVRCPEQEAVVIERYRSEASALGIDPDLAERLCRILIEESVRRQLDL